jgi:hypothetical protein
MVLYHVLYHVLQNKKPSPDVDYVSNDALRGMCENVLQLLSTTVDSMDIVSLLY